MKNKTAIKIIIWDVDGTLYPSQPGTRAFNPVAAVFDQAKQALTRQYWQQPYKPYLVKLFNQYKRKYHSTTKTLAVITNQSLSKVNKYIETRLKDRHLSPDPRLIKCFKQLDTFYHLALRNGGRAETLRILKMLGLDQITYPYPTQLGPFLKVWGAVDDFHEVKPAPFVFDQVKIWVYRHFFNQPGKPVSYRLVNQAIKQVLVVGDRPKVDLKPAKMAGFQTALVWHQAEKLNYIDYQFKTIYHLCRWLVQG